MKTLASRRERRKQARESGVAFEPQYNGNTPNRGHNMDAFRKAFNAAKYLAKQTQRNNESK